MRRVVQLRAPRLDHAPNLPLQRVVVIDRPLHVRLAQHRGADEVDGSHGRGARLGGGVAVFGGHRHLADEVALASGRDFRDASVRVRDRDVAGALADEIHLVPELALPYEKRTRLERFHLQLHAVRERVQTRPRRLQVFRARVVIRGEPRVIQSVRRGESLLHVDAQ
eukprot:31419-Pelagococcus_subviridis.AAC.17